MQTAVTRERWWNSAPIDNAERRVLVSIERFAYVGLGVLLVLAAAYVYYYTSMTVAMLDEIQIANGLNEDYQAARHAAFAEDALASKYRLNASPGIRRDHERTEAELVAALNATIDRNPQGVRVDGDLLLVHYRAVAATRAMFAAVDARRPELAMRIERNLVAPFSRQLQRDLTARASQQRLTVRALVTLAHDALHDVALAIVLLLAASLLCLGGYAAVLAIYKRRLFEPLELGELPASDAASVDYLTGIGNHRAYKESVVTEVARAVRDSQTLSLVLIDIDEMTQINAQSGHLHGDAILASLAILLQRLRAEDRAFRLAGDAFALLLPKTSDQEAHDLMERLRQDVKADLLGATVGIGIAALRPGDTDAETLQAQADAALAAAKRTGRDATVVFDAALGDVWLKSPGQVAQLRSLIAAQAVTIVFQPIWDIAHCTILAYEALARPEPAYGFTGPQDLFDLAERIGRAHEIDAVCRRAALQRARALPDGALLFINMTPQSLDHGRLDIAGFAADVRAAGLVPEQIVIEITERSVGHLQTLIGVANNLQQLGFRLALDDTGAGNAGLEMLGALQLDFVKIDRAVIVKALTDKSARAVLAGIVAIARETGAYVIAEGIEDLETLDLACGHGYNPWRERRDVHGVQGYLLQRPSEAMVPAYDAPDIRLLLRDVAVRQDASLREHAPTQDSRLAEVAHSS